MIKDADLLNKFEKEEISSEKITYQEALKLFEAMWKEGLSLKVLPLEDPLEEIEVDIRIARILNSV
ncbi:MAG: hypothetical protein SV062_11150 [Thermodesulfobacteriota bacterium]|nr:hypothetical protein [Thermodesulfobacteriota bacterium]